jgi:hypothetical protein
MFDLSEYETVADRLKTFWNRYPDGRLSTELIEWANGRFIVKAFLYRTEADAQPWATGLAFEQVTDRGVNSTSALENAETSAIGRSLSNAGISSHKNRASREEMSKVAQAQTRTVQVAAQIDASSPNNGWGETYNASEPITLGEGVTIVSEQLAAPKPPEMPNESALTCNHMNGKMLRSLKTGVSKTGKPYYGWVCVQVKDARIGGEQCPAIWYRQDPVSGEWVKP